MLFLINLVMFVVRVLELVIILHVVLSYFMSPFHPIRQTLHRFVEPLLAPIRRVIPTVGMLDFSPLVLLLIIQILGQVIVMLLQ